MACSIHRILDNDEWNYYVLKFFLERDETSINELDHELNVTPLHRVLMSDKCSLDIVRLLLQHGADVNLVSRISSALFIALMYHKNKDIIHILLQAGADVNAIDEYYIMPPLCMALKSGASAEIIELLLEWGCPIDNSGEYSSMLHCAAFYKLKADVCKLLLQAGAGDVNKLDRYGESVLCYALRKGTELEAFKMLMNAGCSLTACREHASAWLCATAYSSMLKGDILQVLFDAGISISPVNDLNETPLQCALRYCVYETSAIKLLFDVQVGNVAKSEMEKRLLLDATNNYAVKLNTVKYLIERQVQVNVVDEYGDTPLHHLLRYTRYCSPDIIKYLLEKGALVNEKNSSSDTPLRIGVVRAHKISVLELLLKGGARIHMLKDTKVPMLTVLLKRFHSNPSEQEEHCDIIKLFLKYTYLENINYEIEKINREILLKYYSFFFSLVSNCVFELQNMKSKKLGRLWTLYDLINRNVESIMELAGPADRSCEIYFNRILEILKKNMYPVYFDVISYKIGKEVMLDKLEIITMFSHKSSPNSSCAQSIVILKCDCVRKIAEYLSEVELLSMMIAFFFPKVISSSTSIRQRLPSLQQP